MRTLVTFLAVVGTCDALRAGVCRPGRAPACAMSESRRDRRSDWYDQSRPREPQYDDVRSAPPPHPLHALLQRHGRALEAAAGHFDGRAAGPAGLAEGDRVMVQVVGDSPLGLNVALVPGGEEGLVYTDEAGYAPDDAGAAAMGDVLPAYIVKLRDDGRIDLSFRPPGTVSKLVAASATVLAALFDAPEGIELGDASTPAAIRLELGLSKATFKAARGFLLKRRLLAYPLEPARTALAEGAAWPDDVPQTSKGFAADTIDFGGKRSGGGRRGGGRRGGGGGGVVALDELPAEAAYRVSGAAGLLDLMSAYGEVTSLRGLVADGRPTGRVQVTMGEAGEARAAAAALGALGVPPWPSLPDAAASAPGAKGAPPGGRCFVGNLPTGIGEDEVWDTFLDCGYISSISMPRDEAGNSRGFAHIEFADGDGLRRALSLRGASLGGNALRVERSVDEPPPPSFDEPPLDSRAPRAEVGAPPDGARQPDGARVFVGNLPPGATEAALRELLSPFGALEAVTLSTADDGACKGFGHVQFAAAGGAADALASARDAPPELLGRPLRLEPSAAPSRPNFFAARRRPHGSNERERTYQAPPQSEGRGSAQGSGRGALMNRAEGARGGGRGRGGRGRGSGRGKREREQMSEANRGRGWV